MKKTVLVLMITALVSGLLFVSCSSTEKKDKEEPVKAEGKKEMEPKNETAVNPFLSEYDTPFGVPPFEKIKLDHYLPAIKEGIKQQQAEIDAIVNNTEEPTFANTIDALEDSGAVLNRAAILFDVLLSVLSSDKMQKIASEIAPLQTRQLDSIFLNDKLFARIKAINDKKDSLNLSKEQNRLLDKIYKDFVRGGSNLNAEDKEKLKKINEELAVLKLKYNDNTLAENNRFKAVVEDKADLAGLPQSSIDAAAIAAKENGMEGKWVFTLHKPSLLPFLTYSENRPLREKLFKGYIMRGDHNDDLDNKELLLKIQNLRAQKAKLLGFKTFAHFKLDNNMAKTPDAVYKFLNQVWKPALEKSKEEAQALQEMIKKDGKDFKLEAWDWWYYTEKLRKEKYQLDDEALRPYFKLENVINGAFEVANKLFGITFHERKDIPKYHEDVTVYEVKEADGTHVGIYYTDYFFRSSKRGGAWMNAIRKQSNRDGKMVRPVITNNGNFTKPTADKPSLISFEEAMTLFHEFGHAVHGLLSNCEYRTLSGTDVALDFVEMPSQVFENWGSHPDVLKMYAKHYQTGEVIPTELVERVKNASKFNQGFITLEYLAAAFLDMDWQMLETTDGIDVNKFEKERMDNLGLIPEIVPRYRSTFFNHIMGGYSAGYYSYVWAEVYDADAFEAFKENGIFDKKTADAFRKYILESGNTENAMELYRKFRGADPKVDPLLKRRGLD